MNKRLILAASFCLLAGVASAKIDFGPWPEGKSPQEIGKRVSQRFLDVPHQNFGRPGRPDRITYPEVCTWWGALAFAKASSDDAITKGLVARFQPLLGPVALAPEQAKNNPYVDFRGRLDERSMVPIPDHVDHTVFAAVPLELYLQTQEKKYLELGQTMADFQWAEDYSYHIPFKHPVVEKFLPDRVVGWGTHEKAREFVAQGYTWQTRLWIDDMFMITMAQAQAYRATNDRKYIDRAAKEMVLYLDTLQKPNGLFYHDPKTPFFWGRGNGWMAAGAAELLRSLPADNPHRERIMKSYKLMMETLLKHQSEDGMWRQLIDDPTSWPETSSTGMFAFAFISGVKEGWLDEKTYAPAAKKAWLALTTYIDEKSDVREVCQGTNIHDSANKEHGLDGRAYYLARQRITGDMHGQAPVLWCAFALLR
jgi:unsaturated rhamnogalacturonyl hydrolase